MNETNIRLVYHNATRDWTVIIDGVAHRHLTSAAAENLLEYTMVAAEQAETFMPGQDGELGQDMDDELMSGLPN